MRLLFDLDEVLADFVGGVRELYGVPEDILLKHWEEGKWDIIPPLDKALNEIDRLAYPSAPTSSLPHMSTERFWSNLKYHERFWRELKPLPWMRDVIALSEEVFGRTDWLVVSSPSQCVSSYSGKCKWMAEQFGGYEGLRRLRLTNDKTEYAGKGILIDDRESTVEAFRAAGGTAFLFPRHHNSAFPHKDDPVGYVRAALISLKERMSHPRCPGVGHSY